MSRQAIGNHGLELPAGAAVSSLLDQARRQHMTQQFDGVIILTSRGGAVQMAMAGAYVDQMHVQGILFNAAASMAAGAPAPVAGH